MKSIWGVIALFVALCFMVAGQWIVADAIANPVGLGIAAVIHLLATALFFGLLFFAFDPTKPAAKSAQAGVGTSILLTLAFIVGYATGPTETVNFFALLDIGAFSAWLLVLGLFGIRLAEESTVIESGDGP
jgi:hypothetical protein